MFKLSRRGFSKLIGVTALSLVVASCGSGSSSSSTTVTTTSIAKGQVNISYAGSLVGAMTNEIGPAFQKSTGYKINGYPGGSVALAHQIKEKLRQADVFISAVPSVNSLLSGTSNGNLLSWYASLANSPLVIGYNPKSSFASQIKSGKWYEAMQQPGFRLGRTDPKLDPKGVISETLVKDEAKKIGDPSLSTKILGSAENTSQIYPEETLVGRLEAGQLDAGFFYENEAKLAHIPFVQTGISLGASFTVSILNNATNKKGAIEFVNYLYSSAGQKLMNSVGLIPEKPVVHGSGLPSSLKL